jgi:hypothetical protein
MGNVRFELSARERRAKRLARRLGLGVLKAEKPFGKVAEHGGYMVREEETRRVVYGNGGYDFSATLEEVEAYLEKLDAGDEA